MIREIHPHVIGVIFQPLVMVCLAVCFAAFFTTTFLRFLRARESLSTLYTFSIKRHLLTSSILSAAYSVGDVWVFLNAVGLIPKLYRSESLKASNGRLIILR